MFSEGMKKAAKHTIEQNINQDYHRRYDLWRRAAALQSGAPATFRAAEASISTLLAAGNGLEIKSAQSGGGAWRWVQLLG